VRGYRCDKTNCAGHSDPRPHGPSIKCTRKLDAKTVNRRRSAALINPGCGEVDSCERSCEHAQGRVPLLFQPKALAPLPALSADHSANDAVRG